MSSLGDSPREALRSVLLVVFPTDFPSVPSFLRALRVLRGSFLGRNRYPLPDPVGANRDALHYNVGLHLKTHAD